MDFIPLIRKEEIKRSIKTLNGEDLFEISERNGILVYEANLNELKLAPSPSGLIIKSDDVFKIFINKDSHIHRKRFTWAHELGHFFLHKEYLEEKKLITDGDNTLYNRPGFKGMSDEVKKMEIEANFFAAELLMPEPVVREAYEKNCNIEDLANYFKVSNDAMYYRLKNLSIINGEND